MKKLCIVPFTKRELPLLDLLKSQYIIESLVSPKGIGFDGEDVSILSNCRKMGFSFSNQVNPSIECCDTIIVTEINKEAKPLRSFALAALRFAIITGKEVHCFLDLEINEKEEMEQLCKSSGAKLFIISDDGFKGYEDIDSLSFFKFDAPVLYVCEEIPDCDGYGVFLKLAEQIQNKGKKVLAISNDRYNNFVGHTYVNFEVKSSIISQLYRINFIVHDLEHKYYPDIIIIKLPYPLMRFDEDNLFDCGVTAYLTAQAIPGDGCIYCTHATPLPGDFWATYSESVLVKYGYPVLAIHVSNRLIDSSGDESLGVVRIPLEEVVNRIKDTKNSTTLPFFHLLIDEQAEKLGDLIISELMDLPYGVIQ